MVNCKDCSYFSKNNIDGHICGVLGPYLKIICFEVDCSKFKKRNKKDEGK